MRISNLLQLLRVRSGGKHAGLPALSTCRGLIELLAGLQQHRGLSSGWLAGDANFEARMLQRRREIESLMPSLRPGLQRESEEACPCFTLNDWKLFQFRWRELVEALPQASIHDNIDRHNQLIARLLGCLAALGESRLELPLGGRLPPGVARNFASRLPALTECLGQARALGSSVAAQGGCSPVARVRLTFLVARAEALLKGAGAAEQGGDVVEAAQRLVRTMATMVRTELLAGSGVRISSEHYFDAASRAIDAVFAWIESSGAVVERLLQNGHVTAGRDATSWRPLPS